MERKTTEIAENIRSSQKYQMMSSSEQLFVFIYYLSQRGETPLLPKLTNLSGLSKPTIYRVMKKLPKDYEIITDMIKVKKIVV